MGQACCNYADKDSHAKNFPDSNKPVKHDPALDKLLKECSKSENMVVKIQSGWRGHKVRKEMKGGDKANNDYRKPISGRGS